MNDDVVNGLMLHRPMLKGWLEKKPEWLLRSWDERFVVLDDRRIAYHVDFFLPEKKWGTLKSFDKGDCHSLTFRVWLIEGDVWTFRAQNVDTYERWVKTIAESLQREATLDCQDASVVMEDAAELSTRGNHNAIRDEHGEALADQAQPSSALSLRHEENTFMRTTVEKQGAWRGAWKLRVMGLHDGPQISYWDDVHQPPSDKTRKERYAIVAVDSCVWDDRLLLFSTTVGEHFWVRFDCHTTCRRWKDCVRALLLARSSWQWSVVPGVEALTNTIAVNGIPFTKMGGMYTALQVHHHAAAHITMDAGCLDEQGGPLGILAVYGGIHKWSRHSFSKTAKGFFPSPQAADLQGTLQILLLSGGHPLRQVAIQPFAESEHAMVRPPHLYGATLNLVKLTRQRRGQHGDDAANTANNNNNNNNTVGPTTAGMDHVLEMVLIGGSTGVNRDVGKTELWCACVPRGYFIGERHNEGINTTAVVPYWVRHEFSSHELPTFTFHDSIRLRTTSTTSSVLMSGGVDECGRCRSECFLLVWPSRSIASRPEIRSVCALPSPRCFHRMVQLHDNNIVVVGGRGPESQELPALLTLHVDEVLKQEAMMPAGKSSSSSSMWKPPRYANDVELPALSDVAVDAMPQSKRIVVLAQVSKRSFDVHLFILDFDLNANSGEVLVQWSQAVVDVGCHPSRALGCSLHIHGPYAYVVGGAHMESSEVSSIDPPVRILLGESPSAPTSATKRKARKAKVDQTKEDES